MATTSVRLPAAGRGPAETATGPPDAVARPWVVIGLLVLPSLAGLTAAAWSVLPKDQLADSWGMPGVSFVALTLVWRGRRVPRPSVGFLALALVLLPGVMIATALAVSDQPTGVVVGVSYWNTCQGLLMGLVYRAVVPGRRWAPRDPISLTWLVASATVVSLLTALVGVRPGGVLFQPTWLDVWWGVRTGVYAVIASVTFLILAYFPLRQVRLTTARLANVVLIAPATVLVVALIFDRQDLPLTWMLVGPAVWAGRTLSPRFVAGWCLFMALVTLVLTIDPANDFSYAGNPPPVVFGDMMVGFCVFVAVLISLFRYQRDHLIAQLAGERREAGAQARMLDRVYNSMRDGLVVFDQRGRVKMHNVSARQLLGPGIQTGAEPDWARLIGPQLDDAASAEQIVSTLESALRDGGRTSLEVAVGAANDKRVLAVDAWSVVDEYDEDVYLVLLHDITSDKERLEELQRFAGTVAHDLRSPVTSLRGWIELARDSIRNGDTAQALHFLERADVTSHRMDQVIEDWLTYTVQLEGILSPTPVRLAQVLSEVVSPYLTDGSSQAPCFDLDAEHVVEADRVLTRQLLANLISNAVKYTPPGQRPEIAVVSQADDEPGWVRVTVSDRGTGLPAGMEKRIFEEFERGDAPATVRGTGLGLSLCRSIVTRHGGRIWAENNSDGGASFVFTLPAAQSAAPVGRTDPAEGQSVPSPV